MIRLAIVFVAGCLLVGAARDDVFELNEKARAALEAGRASDAVLLLESARQLDGDDPTLTRNLAYAYFQRGRSQLAAFDFEQAAADYRRAAETNPDQYGYRMHLASLLLRRYRLTEARAALAPVLEAEPGNAEANLILGDVLNLMDDLVAAQDAYEVAAEQGEGELAATARRAAQRTARQHAVEQDYETETTPSFIIRHPGAGTDFLALVGLLDRARAEVCNAFEIRPQQRAIVVLYPPDAFRLVTGTHEWVGGLFDRKIRLPIADPVRDRKQIESAFRHEFAHLLVSELAPRCPTFVNEGVAQLAETGQGQGMRRLVDYLDSARKGRDAVPHIADLPDTFLELSDRDEVNLGYLFSYAFVDHVAEQHGRGAVTRWLRELASQPVGEAYRVATGRTLEKEEELFRELVRTAR